MFDIAFSELVVIGVVALVVIGPERLPKVARTMGHMFGRLQRYVNDVKADINREIQLDELRKLGSEMQSAAQDFHSSINKAATDLETGVRSVETELNSAGTEATALAAANAAAEAATPPATSSEPPPGEAPPPASAPGPQGDSRQPALPGLERIQ
jgi:sec-independent protein translocase protein TatB